MKNLMLVASLIVFSACAISPNNSPEANFSDLKPKPAQPESSNKPVQMPAPAEAAGIKARAKPDTKLAAPFPTATPTPSVTPVR